MDEIINPPPA